MHEAEFEELPQEATPQEDMHAALQTYKSLNKVHRLLLSQLLVGPLGGTPASSLMLVKRYFCLMLPRTRCKLLDTLLISLIRSERNL